MSRRRSLKFLSALAAASLVVAACSGDDDDDAVTGDTTERVRHRARRHDRGHGGVGHDHRRHRPRSPSPTTTDATDDTTAPLPGAEDVGVGAAAAAASRTARTRTRVRSRRARSASPGTTRCCRSTPTSTRGNATANNNPLYLMGLGNGGGFTYYDGDLNFVNNDQFGTCTIESLDPLTSRTRSTKASPGPTARQIDAADLILAWAAAERRTSTTPTRSSPTTATTAEADADGNPVVVDAGRRRRCRCRRRVRRGRRRCCRGLTYKESHRRQRSTRPASRWSSSPQIPEISEDGLSVTATWDSSTSTTRRPASSSASPAHVVAQNALGIEDPAEAKQALIDAFAEQRHAPRSSRSRSSGTPASTPPACPTTRAST